ncbi:hypothetical protein KJS94_12340 [Flavihumibacter rivuli]|uniref:hypothetical protein n=1 Tax=Flavihumibacter rivuli TaxID=2838156 RepID=UPI001BDF386B|nr:hypothetical protein [Flavihumibacter rivuli]ULQ55431.1 hypothetical protein KJS94_12340 [Flavihumibacter rivuli]
MRKLLLGSCCLLLATIGFSYRNKVMTWWGSTFASKTTERGMSDREVQEGIAEMTRIISRFRLTDSIVSFSAQILVEDKADSSSSITPYNFCGSVSSFWLKMGNVQMINNKDGYLYIDQEAAKMLVGHSREVKIMGNDQLELMSQIVREEGFSFSKEVDDKGFIHYKLFNPDHLSCKEFLIEFDPASQLLKKMKVVYPDISQDNDPAFDKTIELNFTSWSANANCNWRMEDFVVQQNGEWKGKGVYKEFDIIQLGNQ